MTTLRTGLWIAFLFASADPAQAGICNRVFKFVTGKPQLELHFTPKADGSVNATFFKPNTLGGVAGNQLLSWLTKPLKLDRFAVSGHRFRTDTRTEIPYFIRLAEGFELQLEYSTEAYEAIPRTGGLIIFANHPLSGIDGVAISALISKFRDDVKMVANKDAATMLPGLEKHAILINTTGTAAAKRANLKVIADMKDHVKAGGAVVIFPAGKVSRYTPESPNWPVDLEWRQGILKMIDANPEAALLPIYVNNQPSKLYLRLARINGKIAHGLIPSEVAKASLNPIELEIGAPFESSEVQSGSDVERLKKLRNKVYELAIDETP